MRQVYDVSWTAVSLLLMTSYWTNSGFEQDQPLCMRPPLLALTQRSERRQVSVSQPSEELFLTLPIDTYLCKQRLESGILTHRMTNVFANF